MSSSVMARGDELPEGLRPVAMGVTWLREAKQATGRRAR